jgi:hypothetical protein
MTVLWIKSEKKGAYLRPRSVPDFKNLFKMFLAKIIFSRKRKIQKVRTPARACFSRLRGVV